jgi:SAM-dependent methyltransferase
MNETPPPPDTDRRQFAPATERNREPIGAVLERVLPETGLMLEIAAGSGEHAAYFAPRFPGLTWQPTEPDPDGRASIEAWVEHTNAANLNPPIDLDVTVDPWPVTEADAIFSANMIHIAPWECCLGLMAGAGRILGPGGVFVLYGPFMRGGEHTAPSNAEFDASLKSRDATWGIRDLDDVTACAEKAELSRQEIVEMPANNLTVIFKRDI